jgi:hypothetical protein
MAFGKRGNTKANRHKEVVKSADHANTDYNERKAKAARDGMAKQNRKNVRDKNRFKNKK